MQAVAAMEAADRRGTSSRSRATEGTGKRGKKDREEMGLMTKKEEKKLNVCGRGKRVSSCCKYRKKIKNEL